MSENSQLPENIVIINPKNIVFIEGGTRKLGGTNSLQYILKFVLLFYLKMALPIAILIALVVSLLGLATFIEILLYEAFFMLLLTIYITYMGYKTRRVLETKGKVLTGEITGYDTRQSLSISGYKLIPRLKYRFNSPSGTDLLGGTLIPTKYKSQLPDGRNLPEVGTPVAILYADDKKHTIL